MNLEHKKACTIEDYGFENMERILSMISGKWKIQIIYHLAGDRKTRYGQLKRRIPSITHKVLASQLKELEKDGLVSRIEYAELPLKVEYLLTPLGNSLLPIYETLGNWYEQHKDIIQHDEK